VKSLNDYLAEPHRYRSQLAKLHAKHAQSWRMYQLKQDEVTLASLVSNESQFAKVMARTVAKENYQLRHAELKTVTVNNKERELFAFQLTDYILHGVVADLILEIMQPHFSPRLYSYLKGKNWWHAVQDFTDYIRSYRKQVRDPRQRGLYVLRRDIKSYTDTIPVGNQSPVWKQLQQLFHLDSIGYEQRLWNLVQKILRPEVITEKGNLFTKLQGIPTGSPISTTLFNLYLHPLDVTLDQIPGAFYARYSDDLLFAHPDYKVVTFAKTKMDELLHRLILQTNPEKEKSLYFNQAGRASENYPAVKPTNMIAFLGCSIYFDGTVSLKDQKIRQLLSDLRHRAKATIKSSDWQAYDETKRGKFICKIINTALNPNSLFPNKYANFLRKIITSRPQLKHIDYLIAKLVLEIVTGNKSARSFQKITYKTIRQEWGLISLYHTRNKVKKES
jgi:hypothetical protein